MSLSLICARCDAAVGAAVDTFEATDTGIGIDYLHVAVSKKIHFAQY